MIAADLALHLADNAHTIARHESAGLCYIDVRNAIDTIERIINRPIPPRYCGPCPQPVDPADRKKRCNAALFAPRDADQVTCWACKTTHDIEQVTQEMWASVNEWLLTPAEVLMVMEYFGEPIPDRTFRHWRATGRLQPRGWRDGKPRYWPGDVRQLRNGGAVSDGIGTQ